MDYQRIARKITIVLFSAQSLASAGFIAASTLNAILGAKLGGSPVWAGVPLAVYLLGGAVASSVWGVLMEAFGRRNGLAAGLLIGAGGGALAVFAIDRNLFAVFLAGMLLMGAANAAMQLGRFAAAEVNPPERRGSAISNVVLGGTVGAIAGPLMVSPAGKWVMSIGMDELSGAYGVSAILFAFAALAIFLGLRPDPREIGRAVTQLFPDKSAPSGATRPVLTILRQPAALVAVTAMVVGQVIMVAVMAITSLHMKSHDHMLSDISVVLSSHTFGMYAFSVISGRLADKWGRVRVILTGAGILLLACLVAPLSPDVVPLAVSLFLLGLGWNFCFVGGSTLLADQLSPAERTRTQGVNDLLVGLASATGSLGSGIVFSALGYGFVAAFGASLSLIPITLALIWLRKSIVTPGSSSTAS
jgi:MFS family permease